MKQRASCFTNGTLCQSLIGPPLSNGLVALILRILSVPDNKSRGDPMHVTENVKSESFGMQ